MKYRAAVKRWRQRALRSSDQSQSSPSPCVRNSSLPGSRNDIRPSTRFRRRSALGAVDRHAAWRTLSTYTSRCSDTVWDTPATRSPQDHQRRLAAELELYARIHRLHYNNTVSIGSTWHIVWKKNLSFDVTYYIGLLDMVDMQAIYHSRPPNNIHYLICINQLLINIHIYFMHINLCAYS